MRRTASLKTTPMAACRSRLRNSKSTKNATSRAVGVGDELPLVVQVAERALLVAHADPAGAFKGNAARETFAKRAETDGQVGNFVGLGAGADARADTPGQEFGVASHIGDEVEELVRAVGNELTLRVGGHQVRRLRRVASGTRGAQRGEIRVRMVRTAGERCGGDEGEALGAGKRSEFGEFVRRQEAIDGRVLGRRLEVLADGEKVHIGDPQIVHHLGDFGPRFAKADHQAGFGEDAGIQRLHVVEQTQGLVVAGAWTDGGIEARHGFEVVVEHVRPGLGDDLGRAGFAQEVGRQHLDGRIRGGGADGADDGGEVAGAAI